MAREGGGCRDAHVVEIVAQLGLGRLLAQGRVRGDLRVGLTFGDEPRGLKFGFG